MLHMLKHMVSDYVMKIKEVQAGIKITKNYNSYQISLTAEIESTENPEIIGAELLAKASDILKKKTGIDLEANKDIKNNIKPAPTNGTEVGAAWPDRKVENQLNVKHSTGQWKEVNISNLEKTEAGYKHKTNEGLFIFKKLSKEERTNDRMPLYRIYKAEESKKIEN